MKCILLSLLLFCYIKQGNTGELQWWNSDTVHIPLSQQLTAIGQSAFRKDSNKLYYTHYQGNLCFAWTSYISFAPGYRYVNRRKGESWITKHYPLLDITFQLHTTSWSVSNRCRALYRMAKQHHCWLYRNRTEFLLSTSLLWYDIAPYVSEEFFWGPTRHINQNRIIFGFRIPYYSTQIDLCYMIRSLKTSTTHWSSQNILGIHLSLHL